MESAHHWRIQTLTGSSSQGGFPVPGSPGQPGMPNGQFAPPYGPGGGFYVPQGGPMMGGELVEKAPGICVI